MNKQDKIIKSNLSILNNKTKNSNKEMEKIK